MALDHQYSVAIKLAAENAASGVLAVISKDVLGLHGNVKDLEAGFARWAPAISGAAAAIAGIKLGEMVAGVVEAGNKLVHFQTQMLAATGDIGKVAAATDTAWQETTRNLNTSVADNVKNIQHLMAVTGSFAEAQKMLHSFTVADAALASVKDVGLRSSLSGGEGQENNTLNLARSLEQLGVTQNEEKLNSYLNGMTRAMIAMRGQVDGTKFFNAINNAGPSRYGWDEGFVEQSLGPLIQSTQGRIGVQLYQLDRTFGQGVASSRMQAENLEKYGLYSEADEEWEGGKFKGFKANTGFEPEKRRARPDLWAGDVREMMRARGVNVDDEGVMQGVVAEIGRGNKNLGSALSELLLPQTFQALTKEQRNIAAVPQDAAQILQQKDPTLAMDAFRKQWENLITALGSPMVSTATAALGGVASFLNTLATGAAAHPEAVKAIGVGLIGFAAGLTAVGTALVGGAVVGAAGAAGVSAGVLGAIGLLGTALTTAGVAFVAYKDQLTAFGAAIVGFFDSVKNAVTSALGIFGSGSAGKDLPSMEDRHRMMQDRNYRPTAYSEGANDNLSPMAMAVRDGFLAAFQQLGAGGAAAGMGGGSGGFTNAAYTTFGSTGVGISGGNFLPGAPSSAVDTAMRLQGLGSGGAAAALGAHMTNGEWCADFVNGALKAHGIKGSGSSAALSFSRWGTAVGVNAAQKGDVAFEDHGGGHGHAMLVTGEHDKRGWLGVIAGNSGGRVQHYWENPAKLSGIRRALPSVGAPPRPHTPIAVTAELHVDGEKMASNVSHHMARGMEFPSGMGVDTYGSWQGPATPLTDAA